MGAVMLTVTGIAGLLMLAVVRREPG
jgi:hypothetical protein